MIDAAKRAAGRIKQCLAEAKENDHYRNGWYAYMDRRDIESVLAGFDEALAELEAAIELAEHTSGRQGNQDGSNS